MQSTGKKNLAQRAGMWSARHRKTAIIGWLVFVVLALFVGSMYGADNPPDTTRLLRFPTTNGQQIVFCYAGELYSVDKAGGTARRLTSGPGYTSFSRFSPDGRDANIVLAWQDEERGRGHDVFLVTLQDAGGRWRSVSRTRRPICWRISMSACRIRFRSSPPMQTWPSA